MNLTTSSDTSNQSRLVDTKRKNMKTFQPGESDHGAVLESSTDGAFTIRWTEKVVLACLMLMGFYTSGEAIGISIPLAVCMVEFGSWYRSKMILGNIFRFTQLDGPSHLDWFLLFCGELSCTTHFRVLFSYIWPQGTNTCLHRSLYDWQSTLQPLEKHHRNADWKGHPGIRIWRYNCPD